MSVTDSLEFNGTFNMNRITIRYDMILEIYVRSKDDRNQHSLPQDCNLLYKIDTSNKIYTKFTD